MNWTVIIIHFPFFNLQASLQSSVRSSPLSAYRVCFCVFWFPFESFHRLAQDVSLTFPLGQLINLMVEDVETMIYTDF